MPHPYGRSGSTRSAHRPGAGWPVAWTAHPADRSPVSDSDQVLQCGCRQVLWRRRVERVPWV